MPDAALQQAAVSAPPWAWGVFGVLILGMLAVDLLCFNRKAHASSLREAAVWSVVWVSLALGFNVGVYFWEGKEQALAFTTAYVLEKSLSVDNIFIFLVLFRYFAVEPKYQHRVLFWGILGALLMRGLLIGAGVTLIHYFNWVLYLFGGVLIYSGLHLLFSGDKTYEPSQTLAFRLTRKYIPMTDRYAAERFFTLENGRHVATPLFLVLVMIETTDLVFALDSVPACLAVSQDLFVVYTSNIFAILGLRALFFLLAGLMGAIRFLKPALSIVLVFIGAKMLWEESRKHGLLPASWELEISTGISLIVVASIIAIAVAASLLWPKPAAAAGGTPVLQTPPRSGP